MIASTSPGTHIPRISAQTVTNRLREIGERPPYTMYVLYAECLFWPSIESGGLFTTLCVDSAVYYRVWWVVYHAMCRLCSLRV